MLLTVVDLWIIIICIIICIIGIFWIQFQYNALKKSYDDLLLKFASYYGSDEDYHELLICRDELTQELAFLYDFLNKHGYENLDKEREKYEKGKK